MSDIQNPQGQPQQYQQPQPQYQQPQYQQPQYQQPYRAPQYSQYQSTVNIWEGIAKWDFKTMTFLAVGVFFLSIFVGGLTRDDTVVKVFQFFSLTSVVLVSFIVYAKAAPRMPEGDGIGWPLLTGGTVAMILQFSLIFIKDYDTWKTLHTIVGVSMALVAFPLLYAFFKVKVFEHSLPALLIGVMGVLSLLGRLIGAEESFGRLCRELAIYFMFSSFVVLLAEVVYNRSLNRG